jgi:hypothetical protein
MKFEINRNGTNLICGEKPHFYNTALLTQALDLFLFPDFTFGHHSRTYKPHSTCGVSVG